MTKIFATTITAITLACALTACDIPFLDDKEEAPQSAQSVVPPPKPQPVVSVDAGPENTQKDAEDDYGDYNGQQSGNTPQSSDGKQSGENEDTSEDNYWMKSYILKTYREAKDNTDVTLKNSKVTLRLDSQGEITGSTGCRNYAATLGKDGVKSIKLKNANIKCPSDKAKKIETIFLEILETGNKVSFNDSELSVRDTDKDRNLVFGAEK